MLLKDFLLMSPKAYQVGRLVPSCQNSKKDDLVSFPVCIEIWWGLVDVSSHLPSGLLYILVPILVYCTETLRHRHTPESAFPGPGFLQTPEKAPQFTADIVTHSDLPRS